MGANVNEKMLQHKIFLPGDLKFSFLNCRKSGWSMSGYAVSGAMQSLASVKFHIEN